MIQVEALLAAGAVALAAGLGLRLLSWRGRRLLDLRGLGAAGAPYVIYFTSEDCTVCRTHQEPALARFPGLDVRRVDAVAERELADRFHVYTVPTTVVVDPEGTARHVNYGYTTAAKLRTQLEQVAATPA